MICTNDGRDAIRVQKREKYDTFYFLSKPPLKLPRDRAVLMILHSSSRNPKPTPPKKTDRRATQDTKARRQDEKQSKSRQKHTSLNNVNRHIEQVDYCF
jgi:hypothetical protein